ncbi:hypothetical protein KP509_39G016300 [Ceratopteris richardii]|uniref:Methyltransferase n=1 Tax=Ceratopteris richardii TaxID=49495 RepID=A0A8T2PZ12_CERRI|nr:hypothetical protein KP509_39G016300 [Ceratopteris richardii]
MSNRVSLRSSPSGRGSNTCQLSDEHAIHAAANGKSMEEWKLQGELMTSSPILRNLSLSPSAQEHTSPPKTQNGNALNCNGIHKLDYLSSPDVLKPYSSLSSSGRGKRCAIPLGSTMLLCFVSAFLFIGMLGSRNGAYDLSLVPTLGIYRSHRRLQAELIVDPFKGGIFGKGTVRMKELPICESSYEHYVPCYERDSSFSSERSCQTTSRKKQCLVPPPDDYRIPPRWPQSRNMIWRGNMKLAADSGLSGQILTGVRNEANSMVTLDVTAPELKKLDNRVKKVLDVLSNNSGSERQLGVVLDINCGLSQLQERHVSLQKALILCVAPYEGNGSLVQYTLERGKPAFIGSPLTAQLPLPSVSFDMIHVLDLDFEWKEGLALLELDRLVKPGGYFVWSNQATVPPEQLLDKFKDLASKICWFPVLDASGTFVWRKTSNETCYLERGSDAKPKLCSKVIEANASRYLPLRPCITRSMESTTKETNQLENISGFSNEEVSGDTSVWSATANSYWSLLTPIIFSDHPKRPGEEDPLPPSNIVRNVLDMNALYGGLNTALLDRKKSVWVMNVVPRGAPDTLPQIYKRGLIGLQHDWCEALPVYPRTFDLLHGIGLLSQELGKSNPCGLSTLFLEMDRILRPEVCVFIQMCF